MLLDWILLPYNKKNVLKSDGEFYCCIMSRNTPIITYSSFYIYNHWLITETDLLKIIDNSLKKIFFLEILRCSCHLPSCLRLTFVLQNCIFAVTKSLNKYKLKAAGIIWFDQKNQASNEYQIGQVKYIIHLYIVCLMPNKNKSMKNTSPGFIFMNLSYSEHHFEK